MTSRTQKLTAAVSLVRYTGIREVRAQVIDRVGGGCRDIFSRVTGGRAPPVVLKVLFKLRWKPGTEVTFGFN